MYFKLHLRYLFIVPSSSLIIVINVFHTKRFLLPILFCGCDVASDRIYCGFVYTTGGCFFYSVVMGVFTRWGALPFDVIARSISLSWCVCINVTVLMVICHCHTLPAVKEKGGQSLS